MRKSPFNLLGLDELIVFINKSNEISIRSSICPHFGGEIVYDKKKDRLRCLWHNWEFSPKTGECLTFPIKKFLRHKNSSTKKINKATVQHYGRYGFDPVNIVPASKKDPQKMWQEVQLVINALKNKQLRKLVSNIYKTNKKKLMVHPSSIKMNHNYRSGFLEHVLSMAKVAKKITPLYDVDKDLVLVGVLLNNIGKLREINSEYESDYTFEGNLIGHKVISRDMIRESIDRIKNFPDLMAKKIEHMLISDLGQNSFKYHKTPSFPEALLVHLCLLYTSPSPRDGLLSRMPSSA